MTPPTNDPFTALATGAVSMHELYKAWRTAGFSRGDALTLLAKVMVETQRAKRDDV